MCLTYILKFKYITQMQSHSICVRKPHKHEFRCLKIDVHMIENNYTRPPERNNIIQIILFELKCQ